MKPTALVMNIRLDDKMRRPPPVKNGFKEIWSPAKQEMTSKKFNFTRIADNLSPKKNSMNVNTYKIDGEYFKKIIGGNNKETF
jgi:hypothetical protein